MADDCLVDTWLDRWEDLQAGGEPVSLDRFVAEHCARGLPQEVEEFKVKVRKLQVIDVELMAALTPVGVGREIALGPAGIELRPGAEPVPDYRLVSPLGEGGYGEVWKVTAPGGFQVALKFIKLARRVAPAELRALEIAKSIHHAHVVSISGSWQVPGYLVVAMELCDCTLMDRLHQAQSAGQTGIPRDELLEYMAEAARGIDYLNEMHPIEEGTVAGIVHRDIKPTNLLLMGGSVKVADLGLARLLEGTTVGHSGSMTPQYAPPEFFEGKASRTSDQYSLAVTYCVLRGGKLPFDGIPAQVMKGHLKDAPDLAMIPEEERPAVARALAKDPHDRWPSCMEFIRELYRCAAPDVTTAPNVGRTVRDKRLQIEGWVSNYTSRLDRDLTNGWLSLEEDLRRRFGTLTMYQLARGPGKDFQEQVICPAVETWHQRSVQPILDDASRELREMAQADLDRLARDQVSGPTGATIQPVEVLSAMALPAGLLVSAGAMGYGVTALINTLIFTTAAFHWPIVVGGGILGIILTSFGITKLTLLRERLQARFEVMVLPAIKEALIGAGVDHGGKHIPSLREQLQQQVREAADRILTQ